MSLRARFLLYLVAIHLVFAGAVLALFRGSPYWLLGLEIFFLASLLAGAWLLRSLFRPVRLIREAAEFLREHDFSTRLAETGQADLDPLIQVYNRMAETLRQERIRSEEQQHFLERLIEASPSGVLILDLEGRIQMANPSALALLRRGEEEVRGRTLSGLGSPLADRLTDLAPGRTAVVTLQGRRRVHCRAMTFLDRGFARRFLLLDEWTEELHRSEKAAYEKLIRVMSHEVGNTAAAVGSLLQSCLAYREEIRPENREDFTRALSVAIHRTGRMHQFMREFAEVVRLPAPRKRPADLGDLLREVATLLGEESERRRVRWDWHLAADLPAVRLDPVQMEQALINICRNGLEAIGEDGVIEVRTGTDRGRPWLVIRDSGGGIPPGVREHLFTPFYTSKANGQGIGLTMVQEILLGHGFDFSLETDAPGWAAFTIRF